MDIDPLPGSSGIATTEISSTFVLQTFPQIDDTSAMDNKLPKERLIEVLDMMEGHVEKLRREAYQLEELRDHLLSTLDSVRNADLVTQLDEIAIPDELDDITRYADRIMNRCLTVEVRVHTVRDQLQEEALFQVNHLIDGLVMDLRSDPVFAKQKCISFMNACSSNPIDGMLDKRFESSLLGCTIDDQKRVKKRLQGLLHYFDKLKISTLHD